MAKSISSTKPQAPRGFVLPSIILLAVVLVLLTGAVLNLASGGLRAASHDLSAEQASYAAEYGLVRGASLLAETGPFKDEISAEITDNESSYTVKCYSNETLDSYEVLPGIVIPPGTVYLRSTGESRTKVRRHHGALFRVGLGAFQVGALAETLTAINSVFDAFDSNRGAKDWSASGVDPASKVANQGILASNTAAGTVFSMTDSTVEGTMLVGPGGNPKTGIARSGDTVIANESSLASPITPEEIVVPEVPLGEGDEAEFEPEDPVVYKQFAGLAVDPQANGHVNFGNSCFSMSVKPNGDFQATENPGSPFAGGLLKITGNIHDIRQGGSPTSNSGSNKNGGSGFSLEIVDGKFAIRGSWHSFSIDSAGSVTADGGVNSLQGNATTGFLATQTFNNVPDWLINLMTGEGAGVSAETPPELTPGEYASVNVEGATTNLADDGVYVIKDLHIKDGGTLALPTGRGNVSLYVTRSLTVEGRDAIANLTRNAPNLKVFYTGTQPVELEGGSKSYFTLFAPKADISLVGDPDLKTEFYGAMVGKQVTVENATFHYDIATDGIGAGADSSPLTLLSRHR